MKIQIWLPILMASLVLAPATPAAGQVQYKMTGYTVQQVRHWNFHAKELAGRIGDVERVEISVLGEDGQQQTASVGSKEAAKLFRESLARLDDLDDLYLGRPEIFTNNLKCKFLFRKNGKHPAESWSWRVYWVASRHGGGELDPKRPSFDPLFQRLKQLVERR